MLLNEFLLKKARKIWDDVAESAAKMEGIVSGTVNYFKKRVVKSGRMPDDETVGGIIVSFVKDKYTKELLDLYDLNERQRIAIDYTRSHPFLINKIYQSLNKTSERTALRDLDDMVEKGLFVKSIGGVIIPVTLFS